MTKAKEINNIKNIASTLIKFSLPLILSGILQQLYNWADAFIVGNINGELALATVGSTTTVINFFVTAITGFALGLAILFAQKYGSKDLKSISPILSTFSIFLGGVFTVLAVMGIWLTSYILQLLHTTPDTFSLAEEYLRIIFLGLPFLAVYNVYSSGLRGVGNSKAPFYSVLLSAIVNIILDLVFVAHFRWNVAGAAFATIISQMAMTLFLVLYTIKNYPILRFRLNKSAFDKKIFQKGWQFGFPPMLQSSISSVGHLVLQNFMNGFGTQTVTAITTAYRVDSVIIVPLINLGSGISTLVAQDYGSGQIKRAKKVLSVGLALMIVISLAMTGFVLMMGGHLIEIFGAESETVKIGNNFFHVIAIFYPVYGIATVIKSFLEGIGDISYSSFAGIISLISRIIGSYSLVGIFSNMVIAFAEGFSWMVLLIMYALRLILKIRKGTLFYQNSKVS